MQGDSFNFLGCLLTGDQLATQNLSASYFMFADFMIISQVSASAKTDVLFFCYILFLHLHVGTSLALSFLLHIGQGSGNRLNHISFFCVLLHAPIEKPQNVSNF